jgi:hypothetical protein
MKIEKTFSANDGIHVYIGSSATQTIFFDNEQQRDIVFKHWSNAIAELNASKAIFRPVYEEPDGETRILKLRYTTPEEVIEVERKRSEFFGSGKMKLIMIYNEAERTFQNVNFKK